MTPLARAQQFIEVSGRDIDQARFTHHFSNLPLQDMLTILARYQTASGGFRGLEIDITAPVSNPFAIEIALLYCLQAHVPPTHPLLQRTVAHLETSQTEAGDWQFSPTIYQHDLAPWFQSWTWPNLNPACSLAGLLKQHGLGSDKLHAGVERLYQQSANLQDIAEGQYYSVRPYLFYFMADWDHPDSELYRWGLVWWLIQQDIGDKLPSQAHFFEYVRNPHTFLGQRLPAGIITRHLDLLQAEQQPDGGWPSPYNPAWRPHVTLQNLLILRAFGRL